MTTRRPSGLTQVGVALGLLTVVLFVLAGLFQSATSGAPMLVGDLAWFGFLLSLVALLVVLVSVGIRALHRRAARA